MKWLESAYPCHMLRITVGKSDEDYSSVQEALNAVPYDVPAEIVISEGIYKEKIFSDKESISLVGKGKVLITNDDAGYEILDRGIKRGTFRSYTAFFSGGSVRLSGLTIQNSSGEGSLVGQGIALYLDAGESFVDNCTLLGHQDTLFIAPLPDEEREKNGFYGPRYLLPRIRRRAVFNHCSIEGTVDFIFGSGDALFEDCDIISRGPGYVTAPSGKKDWIGFVFHNCRFSSSLDIQECVYLMRPWRKAGKALFSSCTFGRHIAPEGLVSWPGLDDEIHLCTFLVSDCIFEGRNAIDSSHLISEEQARMIIASFDLSAE